MRNRVTVAMVLAGLCVVLGPARVTLAPLDPRAILKTYFETGDRPTEQQFSNLIDSFINAQTDDGSLVGVWSDATGGARMLGPGEIIGPGSVYGPAEGLSDDWLLSSGFLALSFLADGDTHYGYLQIDAGPDPTSPYPMLVEYLVFETQPDLSVETVEIPEPGTMGLLALGAVAIFKRRRRRE